MKATVSKQSIRELVKLHRLPSSIRMYLAGAWLHDILVANSLDSKFRLWNMAYWVVARRLNRTQMILTWRPV
jgi:hypothetical protein